MRTLEELHVLIDKLQLLADKKSKELIILDHEDKCPITHSRGDKYYKCLGAIQNIMREKGKYSWACAELKENIKKNKHYVMSQREKSRLAELRVTSTTYERAMNRISKEVALRFNIK
ncbi:hypothetical protein [Flavobacterium sp. HSC-61S13]|uniref:hypothetical protein n=1 Tax=Flavobacterium sp. HSC-61S13 TaxID=2910963 RepID=UPI0020A23187|nr:hypothetical protein [Flavobacterium sp. HSC-61S13]MCP1996683.1 putative negative regulator of RcsB-dependent stress response [Flavobacterium sp. HSC-61S13]